MRTIDLRSDTVTQPSSAMRAAMAAAEVGDDCYSDDPSVNTLEQRVAELLGKPAALFVASGTMANQLAVTTHTRPGEVVACVSGAHMQIHEDAAPARLSGAMPMAIGGAGGFRAAELLTHLREESCGWPRTGLVWIENTLGLAGGLVWDQSELRAISNLCVIHARPLHLDGARLWNAHVATGESMAELAGVADSVSVCLSKGLGCPVGSLLVGEEAFIASARASRHAFGGAMRQAGVLAAAGIFALEHQVERLADDHRRALALWEGVHELSCWSGPAPQTNILLFDVPGDQGAERLCAPLREAGLLCFPNRYSQLRLVTHLGVDDEAIDEAIERIHTCLGMFASGS